MKDHDRARDVCQRRRRRAAHTAGLRDRTVTPLGPPDGAPPPPLFHPARSFEPFSPREIEQSIPARFEAQVRRYPDRLAVKSGADAWTYAELDRAADRIAHAVVAAGGEGEEPVGLLVEQGALLIAVILGVLKAGKIYVPLDPSFPKARLAEMLADAQARVVVASAAARLLATATAPPGARVIEASAESGDAPVEHRAVSISAGSAAYIYYTSGSTGRPKGVVDTHRNVLHNVLRYTNSLRVTPDDRLTLLQGPSFSGAVSSMFTALLNGAAVFPFDVGREGVDRIAGWLRREAITIYHSVPSLFRCVATSGAAFPALRLIRLEGDRASAADLAAFQSAFAPPCVLVNGLGATECGIVRQYFVGAGSAAPPGLVPIGYPVQDMDVAVLDEAGGELGAGQVGEIAVRSHYLARGYWRRPDLTAAAFSADPRDPALRTYRTGDLGRLRVDGCLEHLGRKDAQVKIRGNRVETAEVEAALLAVETIREAAVVTREQSSEPALVAYVVPSGDGPPNVSALRRRLAERLPDYMIPSVYMPLDALPLNDNRKVDRRALPAPDGRRPVLDEVLVPPRNLLQRQLGLIWERVLEVRPVGIRDSFFDLGGSSLLAMRMMDEVEAALGRKMPLSVMLSGATIEHLADAIQEQAAEFRAPVVPVQPGGRRPPLFFLHGDYLSGGMFCAGLARHLGPDQPFFAVPPCGLDGEPVPASYREMARRHVEAIIAVEPVGPYRLGGLCNGGLVAYEVARLLEARGARVDLLAAVGACASDVWPARTRRLVRLAAGLRRSARRRIKELTKQGRDADSPTGPDGRAAETPESRRARLRETYLQVHERYVPGRYSGRVTLFWPADDPIAPEQAVEWWRRLTPSVDVHVVPGTHVTCLTDHARSAAEFLGRCLAVDRAP